VDFVNLGTAQMIALEGSEDDLFSWQVLMEIEGPGAHRIPANFGMADFLRRFFADDVALLVPDQM
jgi:hypothetical protein